MKQEVDEIEYLAVLICQQANEYARAAKANPALAAEYADIIREAEGALHETLPATV